MRIWDSKKPEYDGRAAEGVNLCQQGMYE